MYLDVYHAYHKLWACLKIDFMDKYFCVWQMCSEARIYIIIEIALEKPLVHKITSEEMAER